MLFRYQVGKCKEGQSVETVLREEFMISAYLLKKIRLYGSIKCNGSEIKIYDLVTTGDWIEAAWDFDGKEAGWITCDTIPILYQDTCFLIVDKPPNLCVHPSRGHIQDSLITVLSGGNFLNVVTRLDRDTSGLVLLAKNGYWHNRFATTPITKIYYGLVSGKPIATQGMIEEPIEREQEGSIRRVVCENGKHAITAYRLVEYIETINCSILEFELFTGRCHQIRVHTSHIGHPLIGDGLYGNGEEQEGQRLLCGKLLFVHPGTGEKIEIELPDICQRLISNKIGM